MRLEITVKPSLFDRLKIFFGRPITIILNESDFKNKLKVVDENGEEK